MTGKRTAQSLLVGFIAAAIALICWLPGWLDTWEAKTWDWRVRLMARPGPATRDISLILLDQNSLDWAKTENGLTWPWPREVYAAIVNYCKRSGARAVVFDVLFSEPSAYGVEDDTAFGAAVSEYDRFVASAFLGNDSGSRTEWPKDIPGPPIEITGLEQWLTKTSRGEISFPKATFPIPELAKTAAVIGNVHLDPDPDGVYRRMKLFNLFDGKTVPALGLGAYLAAQPDSRWEIAAGRIRIDDNIVSIDRKGNTILRYRGPTGTHTAYSAASVLQSEIRIINGEAPTIKDSDAFKDKYVFFGFTAPALYDLKSAPVGGIYPGVEIHATLLDNLLSNDFIRKMPVWLDILPVFFWAMGCALCLSFFTALLPSVFTCAVFILLPVAVSFWMYGVGIWMSLMVGEAGVALSILLALGLYYATEGKQKRFIKSAFRQYLSPAVIDQLIANPSNLSLGGQRRMLSIFFSDLQGFTSISETLSPEALTAFLNEYLSAMTRIIHQEGGTIDKYEGDAIIAFWNAPLEVRDHAIRSVQAALRCQEKLARMRPDFRSRIDKEIIVRIGINTGPAVVGNLGSDTRFDYTMLGDSVNLASRLEGANKVFGTHTMISDTTRKEAGDAFSFRELGCIRVSGRKDPVTVFEPMPKELSSERKDLFKTFYRGLNLFYRGNFDKAVMSFSIIADHDPPAAAYAARCRRLSASAPADWDGVWSLTEK
jgi:adenylate cyclase